MVQLLFIYFHFRLKKIRVTITILHFLMYNFNRPDDRCRISVLGSNIGGGGFDSIPIHTKSLIIGIRSLYCKIVTLRLKNKLYVKKYSWSYMLIQKGWPINLTKANGISQLNNGKTTAILWSRSYTI